MRAVELGLPMFLGILGGTPEHWAQYGRAYRAAWAQAGHPSEAADIAVAVHGFVDDDDRAAKACTWSTSSACSRRGWPRLADRGGRRLVAGATWRGVGWCSQAARMRPLSESFTSTRS